MEFFAPKEVQRLEEDFLRYAVRIPPQEQSNMGATNTVEANARFQSMCECGVSPAELIHSAIDKQCFIDHVMRDPMFTEVTRDNPNSFFVDAIYSSFALRKRYLTFKGYCISCYLFGKASSEEKLEWLHSTITQRNKEIAESLPTETLQSKTHTHTAEDQESAPIVAMSPIEVLPFINLLLQRPDDVKSEIPTLQTFHQQFYRALLFWDNLSSLFSTAFMDETHSARHTPTAMATHFSFTSLLKSTSPSLWNRLIALFEKFCGEVDRVSVEGLQALLKKLGMESKLLASRVVTAYAAKAEPNVISYQQLIELGEIVIDGNKFELMKLLFSLADTNFDGLITAEELLPVLQEALRVTNTGDVSSEALTDFVCACFAEGRLCMARYKVEEKISTYNSAYDAQLVDLGSLETVLQRWEFRLTLLYNLLQFVGLKDIPTSGQYLTSPQSPGGDIEMQKPAPALVPSPPSNEKTFIVSRSPAPPKGRRHSYCNLLKNALLLFIIANTEMALYFVSVFAGVLSTGLKARFGVSDGDLGNLGSSQIAGYALGLFWSQAMIARYGIKVTLLINSSVQIVGSFLFSISARIKDYNMMIAGNLIWGVSDSYLCVSLLVAKHFPHNLGFVFGVLNSYYLLSVAAASFIEPLIGEESVVKAIDVNSGTVLAGMVFTLLYIAFAPMLSTNSDFDSDSNSDSEFVNARKRSRSSDGSLDEQQRGLGAMKKLLEPLTAIHPNGLVSMMKALAQFPASMWLLLLHESCLTAVFLSVSYFVPSYLQQDFNLSATTAPLIVPGLVNLIAIFMTPLAGAFFDKFGRRIIITTSLSVFLLITFILLITVDHVWVALLFAVAQALLTSALKCLGVPAISIILRGRLISEGTAWYLICYAVAVVALSVGGGYLINQYHFIAYGFLCCSLIIMNIIALVALYFSDKQATCGELNASPPLVDFQKKLPQVTFVFSQETPVSGNDKPTIGARLLPSLFDNPQLKTTKAL